MAGTIRVLYVAGDRTVADRVPAGLESEDDQFVVGAATSPSGALDRLSETGVDCVVSDYDLPGTTGIELFERVRERERDVPFVLYLDEEGGGVASEAVSSGVTEYVRRSSDGLRYDRLATRIRSALTRHRSERHARGPDSRFEQLADVTEDVLWMFTGDWDELLFVNDAYETVWGRPTARLAEEPRDFLNGIHPEDRSRVREGMQTLSNGESVDIEFRVNAEEEFGRWVWMQSEPIFDADGNVVRVAGFARDVTERRERERQYRRERNRFVTLFESLPNPVIYGEMVDGEPIVRQVNPAFEETFGYDADWAVGRNIDSLTVPEDQREEADRINERVRAEGAARLEVERETNDGLRDFVVDIVLDDHDAEAGSQKGYAIYTDITEQKKRAERLRRKNERLDEFAGFVSHDLRNPLNTLQLSLEMAEETGKGAHFERCHRAADRMERLLEDLLALARQGKDIETQAPVDLAAAVEAAWRTVATHGAELTVETDLTIRADRGRLKQLLENLIRNAVEHAGSEARLTVGDIESRDGFYVADDGPGIPPDERDDVFKPGYSTESDGTGFGLAIVRNIAEAHGWRISIDDSSHGGTKFEITGVEPSE